jgi:hypothetical protein
MTTDKKHNQQPSLFTCPTCGCENYMKYDESIECCACGSEYDSHDLFQVKLGIIDYSQLLTVKEKLAFFKELI